MDNIFENAKNSPNLSREIDCNEIKISWNAFLFTNISPFCGDWDVYDFDPVEARVRGRYSLTCDKLWVEDKNDAIILKSRGFIRQKGEVIPVKHLCVEWEIKNLIISLSNMLLEHGTVLQHCYKKSGEYISAEDIPIKLYDSVTEYIENIGWQFEQTYGKRKKFNMIAYFSTYDVWAR